MACPNKPIFEALHHTMCYLYHHQHIPIMYPAKPTTPTVDALQTFWSKGHAEYLSQDCGDKLAIFDGIATGLVYYFKNIGIESLAIYLLSSIWLVKLRP
jgi:hypothetical protein